MRKEVRAFSAWLSETLEMETVMIVDIALRCVDYQVD